MKIWGKRHIIIVSKMIQFLNFGFASFSANSPETLTLMTLWAFKHFWNSVSLTLIPYEGFELLDYALFIHTVLLLENFELNALWSVYILHKVRHRIFPHSSLCFTAPNKFWSFQRHMIYDIIFYRFLRMLDLSEFLSRAKWFYVTFARISNFHINS